jgi:hypothetical protein
MGSIRFISLALATLCSLAACGGGGGSGEDNDPFDTYQACYDEHHTTENFATPKAIEICCIDHPIGTQMMNVVCGDTAATCETYVTANLMDPSDSTLSADITSACTSYVTDRSM